MIIPEIADYELRREFLHRGLTTALKRLDELKTELEFQPMTSETMQLAAKLWADSRKRGQSTADNKELDGDAILAAQAQHSGAVVATNNVGHLGQWVDARNWSDINPSEGPGGNAGG